MNLFMEWLGKRCEKCFNLTLWESNGDKVLCASCDGKRMGKQLADEFERDLRKRRIMEG